MRRVADNLEDVHKNIDDLRSEIDEDLDSEEDKTRLTALAAGLLDETYGRPGNPYASRETKGILTLQCRHVSFSDGSATLSYTGKSGVEQKRKVEDGDLVGALKDACDGVGPQTEIFQYVSSDGTKSNVSSQILNDYIRDHGFTAKDIRKWHANELMNEALKKVREDGPNLSQVDDKEETLKAEFDEALDEVAEQLGHESSTLQSDYLVDGTKDQYLEESDVSRKYASRRLARRIAKRYVYSG